MTDGKIKRRSCVDVKIGDCSISEQAAKDDGSRCWSVNVYGFSTVDDLRDIATAIRIILDEVDPSFTAEQPIEAATVSIQETTDDDDLEVNDD
jgi:hypothetical protein